MDKRAEIFKQLLRLAVVMETKKDKDTLDFYVNALEKHDLNLVLGAIQKCAEVCKFYPRLAEILERVKPQEIPSDEMASEAADLIIGCISRFGRYQEAEAMGYLGDAARIVERHGGGWQALCSIQNEDITSTKAQLRGLAKSIINQAKREANDLQIEFKFNIAIENAKIIQLRPSEVTTPKLQSLGHTLFIAREVESD